MCLRMCLAFIRAKSGCWEFGDGVRSDRTRWVLLSRTLGGDGERFTLLFLQFVENRIGIRRASLAKDQIQELSCYWSILIIQNLFWSDTKDVPGALAKEINFSLNIFKILSRSFNYLYMYVTDNHGDVAVRRR